MFYFFHCFETDNETGISSNVLGDLLAICGTNISIINYSTRSPLTKALFLVIVEPLIVCRKGHENMVLYATPSPRARETVTGFPFTTKVVLWVITEVKYTPPFPFSLYFPLSTPLIFNGYTSSRSFKYANFYTKLGLRSATDW